MILAAIDLPPTSAWFYFLLHLLAATVHITSVVLTLSPLGARIGLRLRSKVAGIMSHGGSAALHVFLGINSFFGLSTRNPDGTVPAHSMLIVAMIAIGLPLYLYFAKADMEIQAERKREYPT